MGEFGSLEFISAQTDMEEFWSVLQENDLHARSLVVGVSFGAVLGTALSTTLNWLTAEEKKPIVNHSFQKDKDKVVHLCPLNDIEDSLKTEEAVKFCRCWKSSKMPYCDGSHVAHNKETGDNVGPVVIKQK